MTRRSTHIPDELYREIVKAAAREQAKTGETVSVAEWIRRACLEKLALEEPR